MPNDLWEDEPDVEWSCVVYMGCPVLVVQTRLEPVSATLIERPCETVDTRWIFDNDRLPDLVPEQFICFADGEMIAPILACEPDPMLEPIRRAIDEKKEWMLWMQVVVQGKPHTRMIHVAPDTKAHTIEGPGGVALLPRWPVMIG